MTAIADLLAVYLADPGEVPGIGAERGKRPERGLATYRSPHGSVRYVWYQDGRAVAALQVVARDKRLATVANVYVLPAHRRLGLASLLLDQARADFREVRHADEAHLSEAGRAWRNARG